MASAPAKCIFFTYAYAGFEELASFRSVATDKLPYVYFEPSIKKFVLAQIGRNTRSGASAYEAQIRRNTGSGASAYEAQIEAAFNFVAERSGISTINLGAEPHQLTKYETEMRWQLNNLKDTNPGAYAMIDAATGNRKPTRILSTIDLLLFMENIETQLRAFGITRDKVLFVSTKPGDRPGTKAPTLREVLRPFLTTETSAGADADGFDADRTLFGNLNVGHYQPPPSGKPQPPGPSGKPPKTPSGKPPETPKAPPPETKGSGTVITSEILNWANRRGVEYYYPDRLIEEAVNQIIERVHTDWKNKLAGSVQQRELDSAKWNVRAILVQSGDWVQQSKNLVAHQDKLRLVRQAICDACPISSRIENRFQLVALLRGALDRASNPGRVLQAIEYLTGQDGPNIFDMVDGPTTRALDQKVASGIRTILLVIVIVNNNHWTLLVLDSGAPLTYWDPMFKLSDDNLRHDSQARHDLLTSLDNLSEAYRGERCRRNGRVVQIGGYECGPLTVWGAQQYLQYAYGISRDRSNFWDPAPENKGPWNAGLDLQFEGLRLWLKTDGMSQEQRNENQVTAAALYDYYFPIERERRAKTQARERMERDQVKAIEDRQAAQLALVSNQIGSQRGLPIPP